MQNMQKIHLHIIIYNTRAKYARVQKGLFVLCEQIVGLFDH